MSHLQVTSKIQDTSTSTPLERSHGINLKDGTQNLWRNISDFFVQPTGKVFGDKEQHEETQCSVIVALMILANKRHICSLNRSCLADCDICAKILPEPPNYMMMMNIIFFFCGHVCDFNQVYSKAATLFACRSSC